MSGILYSRSIIRHAQTKDINKTVGDSATDGGNTATGNFRTNVACPGQDDTIAVDNAVPKLN